MALQSYRELIAWQKAMDLVRSVYEITGNFPREEIFGLSSQLKRASVSVPSNIAEGQGRNSTKEFINHLSIAYGSLMEVETQIMIAQNLNYFDIDKMNLLLDKTAEVGRLINGLSRSLGQKI
jgi:four helix bundle protein